jgi:tetratricopeptide (TPR) repeat protein
MPEILQTWEEQHANAPAFEAQKKGDEAYRARDFEGAVSYFSRAIELYGPETRAAAKSYRNRADVLQRMGRMQDALSDFDEAIALEPTYAPGYRYRARLLIALDRYEDAIRDIASALQREPDSAATLVERGRLLEKMRRYDEASADFAQAIIVARSKYDQMIARSKEDRDRRYLIRARDDTIVDAYVNRGNVFRSLNRIDEALLAYGQALELRPENRDAYMHRGWLYEKQGRFDLARADYEKAASLGTPNDWLKRALERTR